MYSSDIAAELGSNVGNRPELLASIYLEYLPDVIGLQEYSSNMNSLSLLLADSYTQVDLSSEISAYGMSRLYTPIFYRSDKLELVDKGFVLFDRAYNNSDSKGASYAVFRHRQGGEMFTVCNTHFWWKSGEEHDAARVANARAIAELMKEMSGTLFVIGDFNSNVSSEAYAVLLNSGLTDAQGAADITEDCNTYHSYPSYDSENNVFYGSPMPVGGHSKAIDHIFVDSAGADGVLKLDIITSEDALNTSDHCPIYIDHTFR